MGSLAIRISVGKAEATGVEVGMVDDGIATGVEVGMADDGLATGVIEGFAWS